MEVSAGKKILSFFYPITIQKMAGTKHRKLILQLFCNQWLLSTDEAVYSYGSFYTPFRKSFRTIKNKLKNVKSFLLLGTGLGSALKILQSKYDVYPEAVLVDNDKTIIELSMRYMELNTKNNVRWEYDDAQHYIQTTTKTFDLIGVDVFKDMFIPTAFKQESFFALCRSRLNPGGYCIFNMIFPSTNEKEIVTERMRRHFSQVSEISFRINTLFVCRA